MYASSGVPIDTVSVVWVREAVPFGGPSAMTKYPCDAISAMVVGQSGRDTCDEPPRVPSVAVRCITLGRAG